MKKYQFEPMPDVCSGCDEKLCKRATWRRCPKYVENFLTSWDNTVSQLRKLAGLEAINGAEDKEN